MKSLVIGAAGQDGTLLCAELLRRGHTVIGIDQRAGGEVLACDITDTKLFEEFLVESSPDNIFHMAAIHGSAGSNFEDIWKTMLAVNVASLHSVLEYQRKNGRKSRLVYASSSKVFGEYPPVCVGDDTPLRATGLYGISKQTACAAISYYRQMHHVRAAALHLFNHESWLRPQDFFIPKLLAILVSSVADSRYHACVRTLDFYCDWGCAEEYMSIIATVAERDLLGEDYVLARGRTVLARDLAEHLFSSFGLDYRMHVAETAAPTQQSAPRYEVTCGRLRKRLGRLPKIDIEEVCKNILQRKFGLTRP